MKIAFFVETDNILTTDFRHMERGNPGVGGALYAFLLLGYELAKKYENVLQLYFYSTTEILMSNNIKTKNVNSLCDAYNYAKSDAIDIMVVRNIADDEIQNIKGFQISTIVWPANFISGEELRLYAQAVFVKKVVFVSRQHYDFYIDHCVNEKAYYIYNPFFVEETEGKRCDNMREPIVTFMGNLIPDKGFHLVAKIWKDILSQVPDAKLYVIGDGRLYDSQSLMGKYGLASDKYEKEFMPYLLDEEGNILSSVRFLGALGEEKYNILRKSRVGIANLPNIAETFCYCAVEMQAMGVVVVSSRHFGLLDTVDNEKSGFWCRNLSQMKNNIIKLLLDDELSYQMSSNACEFIGQKFDIDDVCRKWADLFAEIYDRTYKLKVIEPSQYLAYDYKWLRFLNSRIKKILGIKKGLAICEIHSELSKCKSKFLK